MITRKQVEDEIIGELLFMGSSSVLKVSTSIDETDFLQHDCAILFRVCGALVSIQKEVNPIEIQNYLQQDNSILSYCLKQFPEFNDEQQVLEYLVLRSVELSTLITKEGAHNSLSANCRFLKEEARKTQLRTLLLHINKEISGGKDINTVIELASQELISFAIKDHNLKGYKTLDDATIEAIVETQREIEGNVVRLPSGIAKLDNIIHGFEQGNLYCIAAEAKIGKSFLSNQIGFYNTMNNHSVGIISMEMRAVDIANRYAGVHGGQNPMERMTRLLQFHETSKGKNLVIRDGSANPEKVFIIAQKMWHEKKIELLIIDYLQLIEVVNKDRVNEINTFVSRLKGLATDLSIPIILITAVLSKQIGMRGDRKPSPSDIRDTGRLFNDADCGIFLWKPIDEEPQYIELFVEWGRNLNLTNNKVGLLFDPDTLTLKETELRDYQSKSWSPKQYLS